MLQQRQLTTRLQQQKRLAATETEEIQTNPAENKGKELEVGFNAQAKSSNKANAFSIAGCMSKHAKLRKPCFYPLVSLSVAFEASKRRYTSVNCYSFRGKSSVEGPHQFTPRNSIVAWLSKMAKTAESSDIIQIFSLPSSRFSNFEPDPALNVCWL